MNQFQPKEILQRSATEHLAALAKGEYSAFELAQESINHAKTTQDLHIFLSLDQDKILNQAKESDNRRKAGKAGRLEGIPVSVKDNIAEENEQLTCASKFLETYRSPYSATVIQKLKDEGAILFGRTNLDEFAMGSSTENSAFGVTKNPHDISRVPGGSSGGSAASVAAQVVPLSIGTDTGGSIRQPASYCGIYGLKPTYGQVSRYGAVAFASSLDQIGPFARTADDVALLMSIIEGHDPLDSTSYSKSVKTNPTIQTLTKQDWKKLKVGVQIPDKNELGFDESVIHACHAFIDKLTELGVQVIPIQSKLWKYSIPLYYILATAEASSNLARFDGIRYGVRSRNAKGLIDLYIRSRTEGFGAEVKRRILLGTYVLSSGYYDAYYNKAAKARAMIQSEYKEFFTKVDLIIQPTTPSVAFKIGEKINDPISMYKNDLLTNPVNLGGVPALSLPFGEDSNGMPIGIQVTSQHFGENRLLSFAKSLET